jgi:hypothetical protein
MHEKTCTSMSTAEFLREKVETQITHE